MWRFILIMMMAISLISALASPIRAEAGCVTVDTVWDSVSLIRKVQRGDTDPENLRRLQALVNRLSGSQNEVPAPYGATLGNYVTDLQAALQSPVRDPQALSGLITPELAGTLQALEGQWQCRVDEATALDSPERDSLEPAAQADETPSTNLSAPIDKTSTGGILEAGDQDYEGPRFMQGILFEGDLYLFFAMLAALILLPAIVYWRKSSKSYQAREARRLLNYPVPINAEGRQSLMTLMDISMNGFKIRHGGRLGDVKKLHIHLGTHWAGGQVRWRNDLFAGVRFTRPISAETLQNLLDQANADASQDRAA